MEIIKNSPDLKKIEPVVNAVLSALDGLTIDEAKLCIRLAKDAVAGQSEVRTTPARIFYRTGANGTEVDGVGLILSKKPTESHIDET